MMFRRLSTISLVVPFFSTAALAADLPPYTPPPAESPVYAPASVYDWSGFYIGAHAGYGWGDTDGSWEGEIADVTASDELVSYDIDGFVGGAQAGYNAQFNNFVLGAEADIALANIEGGALQFEGLGQTVNASSEIEWIATIRGRAGVAFNRLFLYGTGGVAFAGAELTVTGTGPFTGTANDSQTHIGWVAGFGGEYAVTDRVSVGVEAKYFDLGSETYSDPSAIEGSADVDLDFWSVIAKVNLLL